MDAVECARYPFQEHFKSNPFFQAKRVDKRLDGDSDDIFQIYLRLTGTVSIR